MPIRRVVLSVCTLFVVLAQAPAAMRLDAAAPAFAAPQFEAVWVRADRPVAGGQAARSWLWGPQPGETRQEPFAGAPGGTRLVQYFDKARMEANPGADPASPWAVTTGLLTVELVSGKIQTGPDSWESL